MHFPARTAIAYFRSLSRETTSHTHMSHTLALVIIMGQADKALTENTHDTQEYFNVTFVR